MSKEKTVSWDELVAVLRRKLLGLPRDEWWALEQKTKRAITHRWLRTFAKGQYPDTSPQRVLRLAKELGTPVIMTLGADGGAATLAKPGRAALPAKKGLTARSGRV